MKEWKEITYYADFDWARDHHDVVIVDRSGQIVADFAIKHTAEGWQRWGEQVGVFGAENVAVSVETSQGMVVEQLPESGVSLYPIAPVSSKAYRERKAPSGTKSDRLDAWSLADALRLDGHAWKALAKEDPAHCGVAAALPRRGGLDRRAHRSGQPAPERSARILSGGSGSL
jgi:hypothetical protein